MDTLIETLLPIETTSKTTTSKSLTGNIHARTSKIAHQTLCRICKHIKHDEINEKIQTLSFKSSDYKKYGIDERCVKTHIKYMGLLPDIQRAQQLMYWKSTVRCNDKDATVSNVLALADQTNKIAGVYQGNDSPKNVQLFQQFNTIINEDAMLQNAQPTFLGDTPPQQEIEEKPQQEGKSLINTTD